ncbi:hypothetical protein MKO06_16960 [Gramella sp. GC03-9]|uniref:NIPSNAP protein n=1 Tax=Christiangramia oceanisediminis TaxID=2920386 RepID=A0A9X2L0E3_9FLAO|nr:hypothetical protein [Gramella oceanisediminis]MCP9201601.1 hypothetical protein [Gramella oceanisediminis]
MKKSRLFVVLLALMLSMAASTQESSQDFKPVYITMTTTHWNDDPETDFSDWLATEQEYFKNVTAKNDLIISSGVYTHYFTPDNSEIVMVNVYENWDDIEKANDLNQKLVEEAWPDDKARQAIFDKQAKYYKPDHRDEIYLSMRYYIPESASNGEPRIFYVRNSQLAMDGQGSPATFNEFYEKVTRKSKKLKGYYTHRHLWGANSRDMAEVFVFDKLGDIEEFFEEEANLVSAAWADEKEREDFMKEMNKNFTGKHADLVYRSVPELMKSNQ